MTCFKSLFATICSFVILFAGHHAQADQVELRQDQLQSIGPLGWIAPQLEIPQAEAHLPIVDPKDASPAASLLRRYEARGIAGGLTGVVYDNRDRDHSKLPQAAFPQLTHLSYGPALREQGLDYGLAGRIILPTTVIGNSSTALTQRPSERSQARFAMTTPGGAERAFLTYANNHLYVYPEHRDHDDADLFPANWPYTLISQGSSHSDMPFVKALVMTVAAFSRETRDFLEAERLVGPTLQMIFRRNQKGLYTPEQYLSPAAHPTVYEANRLAPERMVAMAAALKPDEIPPMVHIDIEAEDFSDAAGLAGMSERLFRTPSAIARVWRSDAYSRTMTISAEKTEDPNGRALSFEWVLLRGDPEKVSITPLTASGSKATISIDWHDTRRIATGEMRTTDRVDIGIFAWNGSHYSAPGFVSVSFPLHQVRRYEAVGESKTMRLVSVDYSNRDNPKYVDPLLHWTANWRDEFSYSSSGAITRWQRVFPYETMVIQGEGARSGVPAPLHQLELEDGRPILVMRNELEPEN